MTKEERETIEAIRQAPTPTPVSALLQQIVCDRRWETEPSKWVGFVFSPEQRLHLATAFACVQQKELELTQAAVDAEIDKIIKNL